MAAPRMIQLTSPLGDGVLLFQKVTGAESLGRQFEYEIYALSEKNDLDFNKLLGQHITLEIELPDGKSRFLDARVARFGLVGMAGRYFRYRIVARSWTWLLTRTADCRIFQDKTAPDIIKEVFADHPGVDFKESLTGSYPPRTYCVQYRESDYDFVSRLMEEEGIYTFFKHEKGKHTLIIADAVAAHASIGSIAFLPQDRVAREGHEYIREWEVTREIQPGATAMRDYDFEKASVDLLVQRNNEKSHSDGGEEVFDYPGEYVEAADGERLVKTRLEEAQALFERIEGLGNTRALACGNLFSLTGFIRADQNHEYLVIRTEIGAVNNTYETGGDSGIEYTCRFELMPSSDPFRTPRTTRRPFVQGPQTAVVVGPSGEEIFVDKYGRVKVQFFWDRYGKSDDKSSCWIRVSQIWAGKQWGWVTHPRIGQEVIVDFLEGNPDNPIITGRVYNSDQMPPYGLPANKTQSGILTRSSMSGSPSNANEFRFEDKKGSEQVFLHAEKNQDIEVENDETHWVGHDRTKKVDNDENVTIGNNRTEKVGVDEKITIGSNRTEDVGVDEKITIGANRTEKVGANENITIGANRTEKVGAQEDVTIGATRKLTVGASETIMIAAGRTETIGATLTQNIGASATQTIAAGLTQTVGGPWNMTAAGPVTITAPAGLTIVSPGGNRTIDNFFDKVGASNMNTFGMEVTNCGSQANTVGVTVGVYGSYTCSYISTNTLTGNAIDVKGFSLSTVAVLIEKIGAKVKTADAYVIA